MTLSPPTPRTSPVLPCFDFLLRPALFFRAGLAHPEHRACYTAVHSWWSMVDEKKEARLHSAVTQSDASSLSDHWRGLLVLQQHDPLHQHFSLSLSLSLYLSLSVYCMACRRVCCECACMCPGKRLNNWCAGEGLKVLPDGTVCVGVCRDGGEEYGEESAWLRWALQLRPKNHLLLRTGW